jgi:hypothetical protein
MPVSFDQITDAFSIMWCMTLKCRTAVQNSHQGRGDLLLGTLSPNALGDLQSRSGSENSKFREGFERALRADLCGVLPRVSCRAKANTPFACGQKVSVASYELDIGH